MFFQELAFAMGQQAGGASGGQGNPLVAFMPLIILFVIFYFLLIRPQQKKAKEHKEMLSNLRKGDQVITGGGLYGRITAINGDELRLELANNLEVKVNRAYISTVANKGAEPAEKGKKEKDKDKASKEETKG